MLIAHNHLEKSLLLFLMLVDKLGDQGSSVVVGTCMPDDEDDDDDSGDDDDDDDDDDNVP